MALVSKLYCSSSPVVLLVRTRPHAVNGGGFVVTDCTQKVVFKAEGCGTLGTNEKLLLRDGDGNALLLIRRNGGMVEALSIYRTWKGHKYDFEGSERLVFRLKAPNSVLARKDVMRIWVSTAAGRGCAKSWDLETRGYFPERECSIVDSAGGVVAEIGVKKDAGGGDGGGKKEVYQVVVKPGVDQAFVCGVIAILDNIYGESTTC